MIVSWILLFVSLMAVANLPLSAEAATFEWGGTSGLWTDHPMWVQNDAPTKTDDVIINAPGAIVTVNDYIIIQNLTIIAGTLFIQKPLTFTVSSLTLGGTSSVNGLISGNGTLIVSRPFFPPRLPTSSFGKNKNKNKNSPCCFVCWGR